MQYTTRASRLGGYLGPVAHWLYFTPLRTNGELWSRIVIWASGIGTLMAISGLIVGVLVYSPSKRYQYEGESTSIPYSGTKRVHMIFGLFFGIVACTWTFSGMLSMDPFPIQTTVGVGDARIDLALRSDSVALAPFSERLPEAALASVPSSLRVRELELIAFAGDSAYIAFDDARSSWVVPVHGDAGAIFARERIVDVLRKAIQPEKLAEVRTVAEYDAYYLDRRGELPLPVLFVRIAGHGATETSETGYYIDPRTAEIVARYSPYVWFNRWLYHGLHSLNFPWLYNHRPAWDILVLLLLAGGTTLSVTSAIIGWKLLQRKIVKVPSCY
jgi:hypothetical protein